MVPVGAVKFTVTTAFCWAWEGKGDDKSNNAVNNKEYIDYVMVQ